MPQLDTVPVGVALDSAGDIVSGALLKVYTAGTTTPVTTYSDAALTTANAFPVVADSSGRFSVVYVAAGNYKIDLQDAEGASLPGYPRDNIVVTASGVTTGATYGRAIQLADDYTDTDSWTIEAGVGITARAQSYDSTTALFDDPYVLEFAGDASDATNKVESAASVATVTPGQELRVTVPIYATGSPTSTFEIGLEWYTSSGATISESAQSYSNSDITTGQVLHAHKVATAPATAAMVRVIIQRKTASVTGNWYAGAARLEISRTATTAVLEAGTSTQVFEYSPADITTLVSAKAVLVGALFDWPLFDPPTGYLECDGSAISRTTYATLFAAITDTSQTGDTNSNTTVDNISSTAGWGAGMYVEGSGIPTGTTISSVDSGTQITLSQAATATASGVSLRVLPWGDGDGSTTFEIPDFRGEFTRGWDNGAGVDSDRVFASNQLDAFQGHYHTSARGVAGSGGTGGGNSVNSTPSTDYAEAAASDGTNGTPRTASETRPRSVAVMKIIKY